jgi:hypothetical protein
VPSRQWFALSRQCMPLLVRGLRFAPHPLTAAGGLVGTIRRGRFSAQARSRLVSAEIGAIPSRAGRMAALGLASLYFRGERLTDLGGQPTSDKGGQGSIRNVAILKRIRKINPQSSVNPIDIDPSVDPLASLGGVRLGSQSAETLRALLCVGHADRVRHSGNLSSLKGDEKGTRGALAGQCAMEREEI